MGWRKAGWGGRQQVTIVRAVHLGDGGHWPPGHLATWPLNKRCKRCSSLWAVIVGGGARLASNGQHLLLRLQLEDPGIPVPDCPQLMSGEGGRVPHQVRMI
jgi:hypothetical protein